MSTRCHVAAQPSPVRRIRPSLSGVLQRKCSCGGSAGTCEECKKDNLQRHAIDGGSASPAVPPIVQQVLRSPGAPLDISTETSMSNRFSFLQGAPLPAAARSATATLGINQPGDRYEQEADRIANRVLRSADIPATPVTHRFSKVRIHTDTAAADSARAIGALAYTVGTEIVFGSGQYSPRSRSGQHLLAHELAHTIQQVDPAKRRIMGTWDKVDPACVAPKRWIQKVVVDQETPQTVTLHWSDGSTEDGPCSTGKGHCCVDSKNPSGVACTIARSQADGSNCTPITQRNGYLVKNRVQDHKGVKLWTEFVPDRSIALHEYSPVDGTPLSHGCVRLHSDMAQKIFCNVRQNQTWVQVHGFARPKCSRSNLQAEWLSDFAMGGLDTSKQDGDTKAEILEIRRELNAAFGRKLTVEEIRKLTAADIPRCSATAPLPKSAAPKGAGAKQSTGGSK